VTGGIAPMRVQRAPRSESICDLYFGAREFGSNVNADVMIYYASPAKPRPPRLIWVK
jgi:hypothetical protein